MIIWFCCTILVFLVYGCEIILILAQRYSKLADGKMRGFQSWQFMYMKH